MRTRVVAGALLAFALVLFNLPNAVAVKQIAVKSQASVTYPDIYRTSLKLSLPKTDPGAVTVKIQWLRNGKAIKGATGSVRNIAAADRGAVLNAKLTLSKKGYSTRVVTSSKLKVEKVNSSPYRLLWSDEFTGAAGADPGANWVAQEGDGTAFGIPGWGNGELQYYLRSQAALDGTGKLKIRAQRQGANQYNCYYGQCLWKSSKLVTKGVLGFKYGRLEARVKGAKGDGTWPAFWLLGADIDTVPWPRSGEIDIMELKGNNPAYVWGTAHGPLSGGPGRGGSTILVNSTAETFNRYAIDWTPTRIKFYVNDALYYTYVKSDADWVFDREMYAIINLALGGGFGGGVDLDLMESEINIDYVRFYSINGLGQLYQR